METKFGIRVLDGDYKVAKLSQGTPSSVLLGVVDSAFYSITKSATELSIVCEESVVLDAEKEDCGWSLMMIDAVMDFDLVGILAGVLNPLREAGIGIFAVSSFDTDYILVRQTNMAEAVQALKSNGFDVGS